MSLYASFNGTLGTTIDEVESILTHTTWRYRGPHEIKAVGKSGLLRGVTDSQQSKTVSSIRAIAKAAQDLAQAANQSTQLINDAIGGHVLIRREPGGTNEILIMDHEDPAQATKIWRWNLGGLGYSDNVTGADNPDREYTVAMTMDGAINADFIKTGKLIADVVQIGPETTFEEGYDPLQTNQALKSLADGTYTGGTFIDGTSIISPTVVSLQGTFAELMAGDPFGARLEMGESAGEPFLDAYDSANDLRVRLLQDSLEFSAGGITGGKLEAEYFDAGGEGDQAGLLLSSTYSIKLQAFYYAWMETYGAAVQCAGESVAARADIGIYLDAPEIKVQDGILWLRDPVTSTGNRQLDFTGGYSLYRDATGAGGNDTRLWLDTPNFGEVVIGPRSGSSYLGRLRIRAWDILLDGDSLLRPQSSGNGFVGNSTYPFAQMHSYSFVEASSERIKTDIFDMDCKDAYNKVKDLKVRRYKYVGKGKREHLGLISEESPYEILSEDGKGVDLYAYISMLAAAVQEMQAKIEVLEKTISDLRR